MFQKITPADGILTVATIDAELQKQSDFYLNHLIIAGSNDDFVERTNADIVKYEKLAQEARDENNLDLAVQYEEAIKANKANLMSLADTKARAEQTQKDVVELVSYLKELKDGIK